MTICIANIQYVCVAFVVYVVYLVDGLSIVQPCYTYNIDTIQQIQRSTIQHYIVYSTFVRYGIVQYSVVQYSTCTVKSGCAIYYANAHIIDPASSTFGKYMFQQVHIIHPHMSNIHAYIYTDICTSYGFVHVYTCTPVHRRVCTCIPVRICTISIASTLNHINVCDLFYLVVTPFGRRHYRLIR